MKNSYIFLLVSVVITLNTVRADEILWSYDLTELPYMWTQYKCTFSSAGAQIYVLDIQWPEHDLISSGFLQTDFVICSANYDSLVIHTSQFTELYAEGSGNASVALELQLNSLQIELWERNIDSIGGVTYTDPLPIHVAMTGFSSGDLVRFRFTAIANAQYNCMSEVTWRLWDASLTAYGNLSLEQSTWTAIKAVMGSEVQ